MLFNISDWFIVTLLFQLDAGDVQLQHGRPARDGTDHRRPRPQSWPGAHHLFTTEGSVSVHGTVRTVNATLVSSGKTLSVQSVASLPASPVCHQHAKFNRCVAYDNWPFGKIKIVVYSKFFLNWSFLHAMTKPKFGSTLITRPGGIKSLLCRLPYLS